MCHTCDGTRHCSKNECWWQVVVLGPYQPLHSLFFSEFKVLTAVLLKIQVFRDFMLCRVVKSYRCFDES